MDMSKSLQTLFEFPMKNKSLKILFKPLNSNVNVIPRKHDLINLFSGTPMTCKDFDKGKEVARDRLERFAVGNIKG